MAGPKFPNTTQYPMQGQDVSIPAYIHVYRISNVYIPTKQVIRTQYTLHERFALTPIIYTAIVYMPCS